ncbi:hypothetical protein C1H46_045309 [Malus baccata]|uniref:Uncharacterized protein n=1 Tax=Malus baccata TaxID=106549 RepID=A0A540K4K3_MALBA|nr:hypothetical protein C1H46_045309 [Malus baccata]
MSSDTRPKAFLVDENEGNDHLNNIHSFQQQPVFPVMALDHISNLPCDITVDQIRLCSTFPMNFLQNSNNDTVYNFDQGSHESLGEVGLRADSDAHKLHNNIRVNEGIENMEQQVVDDQDSIKHKGGRTANHSASDCTDQFDDDGGTNYRRRTGKKPHPKTLWRRGREGRNLTKHSMIAFALWFPTFLRKVVRLMEALDSLGLEETNAFTSLRSLVSNVFKVEVGNQLSPHCYLIM